MTSTDTGPSRALHLHSRIAILEPSGVQTCFADKNQDSQLSDPPASLRELSRARRETIDERLIDGMDVECDWSSVNE